MVTHQLVDPNLVFHVEDDTQMVANIKARLEERNLSCVAFTQPSRFVSEFELYLKENRALPFVIVTDLHMPPSYNPNEGLSLIRSLYGDLVADRIKQHGYMPSVAHLAYGIPAMEKLKTLFKQLPQQGRPTVIVFSFYVVAEIKHDDMIRNLITQELIEKAGIERECIIPKFIDGRLDKGQERLIKQINQIREEYVKN